MKTKKQILFLIFGILAVFLLLAGCVNDRPIKKSVDNTSIKTIAIGKYVGMAYSLTSSFMPILTLEDNNEFKFELGIGNSIRGTYKVDNNKLVLTSSGGGESYLFGITEHTLIIEQEIPSYVKENTKFVLLKSLGLH